MLYFVRLHNYGVLRNKNYTNCAFVHIVHDFVHTSQHRHLLPISTWLYSSISLNNISLQQSVLLDWYSIIFFSQYWFIVFLSKSNAKDSLLSLPHLPVSCMYPSMLSGAPKCITCLTLGQSNPIPNAIVATTILRHESLPKYLMICDLNDLSIRLVNMSTSLNLQRSGASGGSVKPSPKPLQK